MAITERYVDAGAAGGGNGTTAATSGANGAFTWAEMITDINTPRVGYRYNVKQGTYTLAASSTFTGDGTTTSPNIIRGYKTTIGDATLGRTNGGELDVSNMPTIAYNNNFGFAASGANYLIVESLVFTGLVGSSLLLVSGTGSLAINCKATNVSTGAAVAIENGVSSTTINCDAVVTAGNSSSVGVSAPGAVIGCRCDMTGSSGQGIQARNNDKPIELNTIIGGAIGIKKNTAAQYARYFHNTIVGCSSHGIDVPSGATLLVLLIGNHITGCGGYGINFAATSTCEKVLLNNRLRDNTSGNVGGGDDWTAATEFNHVTSDDADSDDFTDSGSGDYSLKSTAAGYHTGLGWYQNIGANGTPASAGGGGMIGGGNLSGGFQ